LRQNTLIQSSRSIARQIWIVDGKNKRSSNSGDRGAPHHVPMTVLVCIGHSAKSRIELVPANPKVAEYGKAWSLLCHPSRHATKIRNVLSCHPQITVIKVSIALQPRGQLSISPAENLVDELLRPHRFQTGYGKTFERYLKKLAPSGKSPAYGHLRKHQPVAPQKRPAGF
jgi:hypothetical protein